MYLQSAIVKMERYVLKSSGSPLSCSFLYEEKMGSYGRRTLVQVTAWGYYFLEKYPY